jgi:hypothetical protein
LELLGLKDEGFDLDLLGFDADELHEILSKEVSDGLTDPTTSRPLRTKR